MRFAIDVAVSGKEQAEAYLAEVGRRFVEPMPFFRRVATILMEEEKARFRLSPWRPLDPRTIRQKARRGQTSRPLHAVGVLERALTVWGAPGQKLDFQPAQQTMYFGVDATGPAKHAFWHQYGRGVPLRPPLKWTERAERRTIRALVDHLFGR